MVRLDPASIGDANPRLAMGFVFEGLVRQGRQVERRQRALACLAGHGDALYRVAQEALANVARHAQAHRAGVRLRLVQGWVELTIEDDGVGVAPQIDISSDPESAAGRYGIRGMHERVVGLGGQLAVHSGSATGSGIGISVIARLPVSGQAPSRAEAQVPTEAVPKAGHQ